MAFDFGLGQIGVAVGNCLIGSTQPLPIVAAKDGQPEWPALETLIAEWQPDLLVVGDPLNMDGSDSPMSARASKFARRLQARLQLNVVMVDERLTSFDAKARSREQGHRGDYKRQPVDSLAAELILQTFLSENGYA